MLHRAHEPGMCCIPQCEPETGSWFQRDILQVMYLSDMLGRSDLDPDQQPRRVAKT